METAMSHGHQAIETTTYGRFVEADRVAKDAFFRSSPHSPLGPGSRTAFRGLDYFPVDLAYRVESLRLLPYMGDGPIAFVMPTSDGRDRGAVRGGSFSFEIGGVRQILTAYRFPGAGSDALFVPFLDATSGSETYGAGRYLDVEPERDGRHVLDFNLVYHPYCAYSPLFSCPLTPAENRLDVRIEAGERLAPAL